MEGSLEGLPEAQRLQQELKRRYGYHALSIRGSTEQVEAALSKLTGLDMPETRYIV